MKPKFLIMFILLVVPSYATTTTKTVTSETRIYKDASSLGMGGVGVSTIGYQNSVIRNPANLGLMADHDIAPFISFGAYVNQHTISLYNEIYSAVDDGWESIDYNSLLDQSPAFGFNGPLNLGYMGHGFGIWTTSSFDSFIAITPNDNPESFFNKNDIDVNMNDLADAAGEIEKELSSLSPGESMSLEDVQDILSKYLGDSMSEDKIMDLAEELSAEDVDITEFVKDVLPLAQLVSTAEITVNLAYGYRIPFAFINDVSGLALGATVRFAQRYKVTTGETAKSVDEVGQTLSDISDNIYHAGSISSDFGASLRLGNFILAAAVRDAFSTEFAWKNFDSSKVLGYTKIPMSVDFGASYRMYFDNKWIQEVGMYVEFEDATDESTSWSNKLRLGSEVKLFNFLDARVGLYKEFVTGGVGFGWKWFRMDFAYYREKYLNYFDSDQYYLNMTVGLDNSPQRKEKTVKKQLDHDRIQAQNLSFLNQSLDGV